MRTTLPVGIAFLVGGGLLGGQVSEIVNPPVPPSGLEVQETHAAGSLLGQFRTSLSAWLWVRTDLYLHNGVEMRPLTEEERASGQQGVGGRDDGHEAFMNDQGIVSVVPEPSRDFRGLFGELERATSAYKDMAEHDHNAPEQTLPLFRLMTWLDPQFIQAWVTGATILARDRSDSGTARAIAFLDEASPQNPFSVAIPCEKARLLVSRKHDLVRARPLLEAAMERGVARRERLPEIEREALNLSARLLALVYRDLGQQQRMEAHLQVAMRLFPDDPMFTRLLGAEKTASLPDVRP